MFGVVELHDLPGDCGFEGAIVVFEGVEVSCAEGWMSEGRDYMVDPGG